MKTTLFVATSIATFKVPVTLVPGIKHIGLTLEPAAVAAVVRACH